jgi:hypothetical protein
MTLLLSLRPRTTDNDTRTLLGVARHKCATVTENYKAVHAIRQSSAKITERENVKFVMKEGVVYRNELQ